MACVDGIGQCRYRLKGNSYEQSTKAPDRDSELAEQPCCLCGTHQLACDLRQVIAPLWASKLVCSQYIPLRASVTMLEEPAGDS